MWTNKFFLFKLLFGISIFITGNIGVWLLIKARDCRNIVDRFPFAILLGYYWTLAYPELYFIAYEMIYKTKFHFLSNMYVYFFVASAALLNLLMALECFSRIFGNYKPKPLIWYHLSALFCIALGIAYMIFCMKVYTFMAFLSAIGNYALPICYSLTIFLSAISIVASAFMKSFEHRCQISYAWLALSLTTTYVGQYFMVRRYHDTLWMYDLLNTIELALSGTIFFILRNQRQRLDHDSAQTVVVMHSSIFPAKHQNRISSFA